MLSRCQVFVLERLDAEALEELLLRAEAAEGRALPLDEDARVAVRAMADGDGRFLLNLCEQLFQLQAGKVLDTAALSEVIQFEVYCRSPPFFCLRTAFGAASCRHPVLPMPAE